MRGKVSFDNLHITVPGITPAYAGKSKIELVPPLLLWDHPRLCGEKFHRFGNFCICQGSPPPMRGKALNCISGAWITGITPAYAGKRGVAFDV